MTDATPTVPASASAAATVEVVSTARVFKIGTTTIAENEMTADLSNEAVRDLLKEAYPEVANATVGVENKDGVATVTFLPQPGRKG